MVSNRKLESLFGGAYSSVIWSVIAVCAVLFSAACGGDDDGPAIDAGQMVDAGPMVDAAGPMIDATIATRCDFVNMPADAGPSACLTNPDAGLTGPCDPVCQTGCQTGEKCAQLVQSASPFLASTTCVANGTVPSGGACTEGAPGVTGFDDCIAGFDCSGGVCTEICSQGPPDTCSQAGTGCVQFENLFDDVEGDVGLCSPSCDPVCQNCADTAEGCFLLATLGTSTCAAIPALAVGKFQDDPCYGPAGGGCYLNGCDKGHAPILNDSPTNVTGSVCAFFCHPVSTYTDPPGTLVGSAVGDPTGITCATDLSNATPPRPSGPGVTMNDWECRYVQTFYSNTDMVPDSVGMCVSKPIGWGSCADLDKAGFIDAVNTMNMSYCDPTMNGGKILCPAGCVSSAIFDLWFPSMAKRDLAREILELGLVRRP